MYPNASPELVVPPSCSLSTPAVVIRMLLLMAPEGAERFEEVVDVPVGPRPFDTHARIKLVVDVGVMSGKWPVDPGPKVPGAACPTAPMRVPVAPLAMSMNHPSMFWPAPPDDICKVTTRFGFGAAFLKT